jgi:hypothetical protein
MTTVVYHIPLHLVAAYRGRKVIVRAQDPAELVQALSERDREHLVGVQLLALTADVEALADWGPAVPVELAMFHPQEEFPLLYRHAKLLGKHPVRVSLPVVPGFSKAVKVATSLRFSVKLEVNQPDPTVVEELRGVVAFYLHHPSVSQPVEYFHSTLLSFYHHDPVTLWDVQEEDPAVLRYVTEDGRETVARRFVNASAGSVTDDLGSFVADLKTKLLAEGGECASCEFFAHCGGYFKWPHRDFGCDSVKTVFHALREAAGELEHDLATFLRSRTEAAR